MKSIHHRPKHQLFCSSTPSESHLRRHINACRDREPGKQGPGPLLRGDCRHSRGHRAGEEEEETKEKKK
jgi:hypothetical protein